MIHLGPEECPLCWRFDCQCWKLAASGTEARQRQDPEEGLDPEGDGPTGEAGDAPNG